MEAGACERPCKNKKMYIYTEFDSIINTDAYASIKIQRITNFANSNKEEFWVIACFDHKRQIQDWISQHDTPEDAENELIGILGQLATGKVHITYNAQRKQKRRSEANEHATVQQGPSA